MLPIAMLSSVVLLALIWGIPIPSHWMIGRNIQESSDFWDLICVSLSIGLLYGNMAFAYWDVRWFIPHGL